MTGRLSGIVWTDGGVASMGCLPRLYRADSKENLRLVFVGSVLYCRFAIATAAA